MSVTTDSITELSNQEWIQFKCRQCTVSLVASGAAFCHQIARGKATAHLHLRKGGCVILPHARKPPFYSKLKGTIPFVTVLSDVI